MFKSLAESKVPSEFLIIQDSEDATGEDLFVVFLNQHAVDEQTKNINLICYENPPDYYLLNNLKNNKNIKLLNYFSDPCNWKNSPVESFDSVTSNSTEIIFIDSLSFLVRLYGFYNTYKKLSLLKKTTKKIICLAHEDLFSLAQLEQLKNLASALIIIQDELDNKNNWKEKSVLLMYKKPGGKIIAQEEIVSINEKFQFVTCVKANEKSNKSVSDVKSEFKNLTTFKLGIEMSDNERKAKEELVLPYLKKDKSNSGLLNSGGGKIIYHPETEFDMEDDPDDDLDI